jgi:hypothetical protein
MITGAQRAQIFDDLLLFQQLIFVLDFHEFSLFAHKPFRLNATELDTNLPNRICS